MNTAIRFFGCLITVLFFLVQHIAAQESFTVESVPDPKKGGGGYVSDPGGFIDPGAVQQLNYLIGDLEGKATAQIAVVVLPSIGTEVPKDFATRLFNYWGIGQKEKDNGLLILAVMDQRRVEFETGYGLEGLLPDVICYRIINEDFVPYFKAGEYGAGLIAAVVRVKTLLEDPSALAEIRAEMTPKRKYLFGIPIAPPLYWYIIATLLFHLAITIWVILTLANKEELYDKYRHVGYVRFFIFIILFPVPYLIFWFALGRLQRKLRNQPRYSKLNGKLMHKLTEEEEDAFLEKGQVAEEVLGSVDYDVWVTDDQDDVQVLRYAKLFSQYNRCPKCGFRTYHHAQTNILRQATYSHSGKEEKIYECKNCHFLDRRIVVIPQKTRSSSGSSFGGGGGGGGGSWGGGSSGGGGAGGGW